jgi:hypothetical protein
MSVVTQLYFQIVEENNYMFRPFSEWAIIRLRLESRRILIYFGARGGAVVEALRYIPEGREIDS